MRQIGAKAAIGWGSGHGVAVDARGSFIDAAAGGDTCIHNRGLFLSLHPSGEAFGRIHVDAQEHLGVLRAAVLRALAEEQAGLVRIEPHIVDAVRNQVSFSVELRNPEAVIRVRGEKFEKRRSRISWIADGNVKFVRSDDTERGVAELPPELMTDGDDIHSSGRLGSVLNGMYNAGAREEQDDNDQDWNDSPGEFDLGAAIDLRGFARRVALFGAELVHAIDKQRENDNKDEAADFENEARYLVDHVGGCRAWEENIGNRIVRRRGRAKSGGEKKSQEKQKDSQKAIPDTRERCVVRG